LISDISKMKSTRILVNLDGDVVKIIRGIKGIGTMDAQRLKSVIIAYLSEKGYFDKK